MPHVAFVGLGRMGRGPVTGLPDAATEKLTLLVGADRADLEKARPFPFELIGSTIRHFGAVARLVAPQRRALLTDRGISSGLPLPKPAYKPPAVARSPVPGRIDFAAVRYHEHGIQPL